MKRLTLAVLLCLTLCFALSTITTDAAQRRGGPRVRYRVVKHIASHGRNYARARGHYQNVSATALCADGTYSYSANRRGTCSHHGDVAQWLSR
jgi:Protein of unknown function (DUF3761)